MGIQRVDDPLCGLRGYTTLYHIPFLQRFQKIGVSSTYARFAA
jgi:hypothetical protein